ncbi:hypothetical protein [Moritella viscosa]|uniref:Uncharacterized protein n=2 Tax=Moritella viscosa TaxID=80854 RepID=A0ABY1HBD1_9GAMM|nr:hypothetical protein [Moritella viscosa]SGY84189.1 unnamed protein product [Moritella viscosa]SGY86139.1 unnamed protein product [Moritella viscosa]SHO24544.1 unnamed protein product [Moritella viscosa]
MSIAGLGFATFAFIVSPLITEYIDVYFIVIIVVVFCVDWLEIRKLKAEIKQLKSKSSAE